MTKIGLSLKKILLPIPVWTAGLAVLTLLILSCQQKALPLMERVQKDFENKRYVDVIDNINLALKRHEKTFTPEEKSLLYEKLGKAYQKISKHENALDSFSKAVHLSKKVPDAAYEIGNYHRLRGEYAKAEPFLLKSLAMKKDAPLALIALGDCYYFMERYSEAKDMYNQALDVYPWVRSTLKSIRYANQKLEEPKRKKK